MQEGELSAEALSLDAADAVVAWARGPGRFWQTSPVMVQTLEKVGGQRLPEAHNLCGNVTVLRVDATRDLFDYGESHPYLYAVAEGIVRVRSVGRDGREAVSDLCQAGDLVLSLPTVGRRAVGHLTVDDEGGLDGSPETAFCETRAAALKGAVIERVEFALIRDLAHRHEAWARAMFNVSVLHAIRQARRMQDLLTLTPEERYRSLLETSRSLLSRVPQKDIASYLGITSVGLCRIAKRVQAENSHRASGAGRRP